MVVIGIKILVAILMGLLGAWGVRHPVVEKASARRFLGFALSLQVLPAVVLFVGVYVMARQPISSDVPGYYGPASRAVLAGELPYRDFGLSYAPLFPYVGAALLRLWDNDRAFAVFGILINALALVLWHQVALQCTSVARARQATVLYASGGHVLLQTLLGTSQIWVATGLAGSALLILRERALASGVVQALSICATKLLTLLFWPILWMCTAHRVRWVMGAALLTSAVYVGFTLLGADILDPLRRESENISSGNIPYLLEPLSASLGRRRYLPYDVLAALGLAAAWLWMYRETRSWDQDRRARALPAALALIGLVFMLLSKKSASGYEVFILYPATLVLVGSGLQLSRQIALLSVLNVLLVAEPSVWFRVGNFQPLSEWIRGPGTSSAVLFALVEIVLVTCHAFLAWQCVKSIQASVREVETKSAEARPAIAGATI